MLGQLVTYIRINHATTDIKTHRVDSLVNTSFIYKIHFLTLKHRTSNQALKIVEILVLFKMNIGCF